MGDVRDIKDAAWAAYCKAPTCRDMGRSKVDAAVDSVLAISARAEVPEGVSRLVDALEGAMIESLHGEGFDLWAKNRGKFRNRLPENVGAIVVKMRALLAAAPQPAGEPRSDLVPGVMRCAKCAFQLHRVTLYVRSGTTGAGDSDTEPCPNGCGPLWPVTWRQWAEEAQEYAQRLQGELDALKAEPAPSAPAGVEALLRSTNSGRKDFTAEEALMIADRNDAAHRHVPSVSRTLASEVRRLYAKTTVKDCLTTADVEALAGNVGVYTPADPSCGSDRTWTFSAEGLHDFARRLVERS